MPKKFKGENSKAAEARARKDAKKIEENERKVKAAEDAYWADNDKHVVKKQARKEAQEKKRQEQLDRKAEKAKLYEEEMSALKSAKPLPSKLTRAEIEEQRARMAAEGQQDEKALMHDEVPLEENINRMDTENEARNVEEAISVLSVSQEKLDRHPEKRVKAAYTAYEDKYLPILKAENPNMRLSQLKQMLKKDWMKSPENPLNQRSSSYNAKK